MPPLRWPAVKVKAHKRPLSRPLSGGTEGATVAVDVLEIGRVTAPPQFFERAGGERIGRLRMLGPLTPRSNWWKVPCPAYLVTHPTAGHCVVDTGLHPSVTSKPSANMGRAVAWYGRPELEPGEDLPAQLRAKGVDPKTISTVVMTHLHFDHASGMAEFAGASFVLSEREWEAATTGQNPFFHGYRPAQYDYAFDYRTIDFDGPTVGSYASFGRTFDLFGDGSVRLAYTPGHSAGHQSVICRLRDRDLVIAGDAIYTLAQLADAPPPPRPEDPHTWRRSVQELRLFQRQYPQAVIIPGHDPRTWAEHKRRYE
jgi:glyoxylase-like metal-dependent hydrolase (beta-lactamase superfamily II)